MESINTDTFFKFQPNALYEIRKNYDLEKPGAMSDAIDILEEWLKKQEHFVKKDFDRIFLEITIIRAKGSVERSKQRLDKMCTARTLMPSLFPNCKVTEFQHVDLVDDAFLPRPTSDNYRVYLTRIQGQEFVSKFYTNAYARFFHYLEYQYAYDYSNGMILVFDERYVNMLAMVKGIDLVELQNMINVVLDCYGIRLKGIHFLSSSKVVSMLAAIIKQMLSAKLAERVHVHKTPESLYEYVDKDILPEEYGGSEMPIAELHQQFVKELCKPKFAEHLAMMSSACTNETYRPTDKFNEQCMDLPGTFRSLKVD